MPQKRKKKNETCKTRNKNEQFCDGYNRRCRGVMVIVIGNEHGDTSSNPTRD